MDSNPRKKSENAQQSKSVQLDEFNAPNARKTAREKTLIN